MKHLIAFILLSGTQFVNAQTLHLSGQVLWPAGGLMDYPMTLHIERDGCPLLNAQVDFTGGTYSVNYILSPLLCQDDSVRIYLSGEAKARAGISTLDLVTLVKYLLGQLDFVTSLQLIAADVNNSEYVSAIDLVEIRKLILGYYQDWPKGKTLNFFVRESTTPPPLNVFPKPMKVLPPEGGAVVIDFWGVKKGDFGQF